MYGVKFTFITTFPIKELPSLYSVEEQATVLLVWGIRGWSLELAEWLKLRDEILERMEPQREGTYKPAYNSLIVLADLWIVHVDGML